MSSSTKLATDQSLIRRFLDQPAEIAAAVRSALEKEGEAIRLYAWADFYASLELKGRWVVVTDSLVVIADDGDASGWRRIRL